MLLASSVSFKTSYKVCPSYGFPYGAFNPKAKPSLWVITIEALHPNSYFLCTLPFEIHSTEAHGDYTPCFCRGVFALTNGQLTQK